MLRKEWEYDRTGELVRKVHSRNGQTRYSYDALGRIIGAMGPAGNEFFTWDAAANLVDTDQVGGYVKYNRVTVYQDKRYEYDVHGRMETKRIGRHTEQDFRYDGEHRLREVHTVRNGVEQVVYFDYDALGRRIRKRDAFGETLFLWDGLQMLQEQRGGNVATYLYEPGTYVPLARVNNSAKTRLDLNDRFTNEGASLSVMHFLNANSGAPEELYASADTAKWKADYKVWGNYLHENQNKNQTHICIENDVIKQKLRFQVQYYDIQTGLHYNTFCHYDPDIGRYITADPIRLNGGTNFYRYSYNPLTWIDPLGWACWSSARKNYWIQESKNNPTLYSASNIARIKAGDAPRIQAEVIHRRTGTVSIMDFSMELHHATIPQRVGGTGVHSASNLLPVTPWQHEAIDPYRHVGYDLVRIVKDIGTW